MPKDIFEKLKTWGLRGVLDYLVAQHRDKRLKHFFAHSIHDIHTTPQRGITIVAPLGGAFSLSKTMRDFAFALKAAGIPFQTFDLSAESQVSTTEVEPILTPPNEFDLLKYDHIIQLFSAPLPDKIPVKRSRIIFWEFESGLLEYDPKLDNGQDVIAMSDFNLHTFKKLLPEKNHVRKILYPFHFEQNELAPPSEIRRKYGIKEDDFVVFFNFDFDSSYYRKNPEGALRAFALAFKNRPNVRLVFKTQHAAKHPDMLSALKEMAKALDVARSVLTINDYIPQRDLYGLTNACDIYLSLHRGEGFGLGIAEAMSLGKPVIVTGYSAPTEFCNTENSILVPFEIVPAKPEQVDNPCYRFVKEWAEPNVTAAAAALVRLHDDKNLRLQLGAAGLRSIHEHFSSAAFRKSVETFLMNDSP